MHKLSCFKLRHKVIVTKLNQIHNNNNSNNNNNDNSNNNNNNDNNNNGAPA